MNNTQSHIVSELATQQSFSVVCRGSWLSLAQAAFFKQKVAEKFPLVTINIIVKETAGDKNQSTPLHLVEGKDFFTKDIQDFLETGQADFAVHSMKDVSGEDFFKEHPYALIDRDDLRDVAIFNNNIIDKLKSGKKILIGTSSPRRSNMATAFLREGLPRLGNQPALIEAIPIRGNVDVRLKKLREDNEFDGVILAAAGLNRLLRFPASSEAVNQLLHDKKIMLLPLFECPPAAGQGAIVAETTLNNKAAIAIINGIRNEPCHAAILQERRCASKYGYGCSQQFGAFHVNTGSIAFTYAAGSTAAANHFAEWDFNALHNNLDGQLFSSTDFMKDFFSYNFLPDSTISSSVKAVFVASHKAIHSASLVDQLANKRVWVAGSRTWLELAKKGIWVEGSADGLGMQFLEYTFKSPLVNLQQNAIEIITNSSSALQWQKDGAVAVGTYQLLPALTNGITSLLENASVVFWTSFQQYELCRQFIKAGVTHCCLPGKTALLLQQEGIEPVIFPGIKAFNVWRTKHTTAIAGE